MCYFVMESISIQNSLKNDTSNVIIENILTDLEYFEKMGIFTENTKNIKYLGNNYKIQLGFGITRNPSR